MEQKIILLLAILCVANGVGLFEQYYPLADQIAQAMTLQQKIGQTLQVDLTAFNDEQGKTHYEKIVQHSLGSILVGGNGCPDGQGNLSSQSDCFFATNAAWREIAQKSIDQKIVVNVPGYGEVKVKLLLGTDAVHGNQHSIGAVLFPHNIGLAATHNVENYIKAAFWTKTSIQDCGFNFAFAPTVAVSHNPKWGRFYETSGQDPAQIREAGKAYVKELQEDDGFKLKGVLASTKHYFGDGATFGGYDEGNCRVDNFEVFYNNNVQGYIGALESNTGTIMVSYSAINNLPMSISELINVDLKQNRGFDGFIISDYNAAIKVAYQGLPTTPTKMSIDDAYTISFNSGMDMQMVDGNAEWYEDVLNRVIGQGRIPIDRINDAVKRIIAVKLAMNLIEIPNELAQKYNYKPLDNSEKKVQTDNNEAEYFDALRSAKESLVLLKNKQSILPLNKYKITNVILIGERLWYYKGQFQQIFQDFDNIGAQNGGWTIRWQGYNGNDYWKDQLKKSSRASSILDGIKDRFNSANIYYVSYSNPKDYNDVTSSREQFRNNLISRLSQFNRENTVIIDVLAENPYAEFMGDVDCEYCKTQTREGCIYNNILNNYLPDDQSTTLEINNGDYEKQIINLIRSKDIDIPVVTVLFSGRPLIITNPLSVSSAFIAAWWPGTAGGEAVVQSIFGEYLFRSSGKANTLPVPWIRNMAQLSNYPIYGDSVPQIEDPLFEEGYGLETKSQSIQ